MVFGLCSIAVVGVGQSNGQTKDDTNRAPENDGSSRDTNFADLKSDTEKFFRDRVTPFIKTYCLDCHSNKKPTEAGVNFSPTLKTPGHAAFSEQWKNAAARVKAHDMPPDYEDQPSDADRQMFVEWLEKIKYLSEKDPGHFVIRRLTKTEYANTLRDLFGVDGSVADTLPDEVSGEGYLNSLSPMQLEQYLEIADKTLDQTWSDKNLNPTKILEPFLNDALELEADARDRARSVARSVAKTVFRRPVSEAEVEVLLEVFDLGTQNELDHQAALRLMLKSMLVSPQFLFITPAGQVESASKIVPLDDYQLASRLSYLLWATMPDAELTSLADQGKLQEPDVLKAQVKRLLADPRSRALFDGFAAQWLRLDDLKTKVFDPDKFPQMTNETRTAMYDEARLFFDSVLRENSSVVSFIESDYTFLNDSLASFYGLEDNVTGRQMRRVKLSSAHRGGLLGMPAILAATSFPNRTSPVKRGVWVLEQVLGEHVPSAPPDVPELKKQDSQDSSNLTLRELTELHTSDPVCANCHTMLDPIGFGLENFDAIGQWRERDDNGEAIDASGELPGGERFSGVAELKAILAGRADQLSRNLVEKLLAYALCRKLEGYDEIVVDELMQTIAADGYRMQTLVEAVVTSYPFTHRRIEDQRISR
ncbi:hypothetical protein Pla100_44280 [Neorhodopirellula pilleata]|uniref:Cytochrome c domain-containing protein n=2 Tax=Neorhodopirellula pilleata TaxID=2714738 RepID=A0A5C6A1I4_9BACT|nr:hypothetical protein Pla100_44280 [Neorhodopirellula pilleata]